MPRRRRLRRILAPPKFKGYSPYGAHRNPKEPVTLLYEEYEAIKLADYDLMNHLEASERMEVSRATFARIYETARRKIAKAMVEVREIRMHHGHSQTDQHWFICNGCNARFTIPMNGDQKACPMCKQDEITSITGNNIK